MYFRFVSSVIIESGIKLSPRALDSCHRDSKTLDHHKAVDKSRGKALYSDFEAQLQEKKRLTKRIMCISPMKHLYLFGVAASIKAAEF